MCDPFAIRLMVYLCFLCTYVPSVCLHVVEFTCASGFESLPLRQLDSKENKGEEYSATFRADFPKLVGISQ